MATSNTTKVYAAILGALRADATLAKYVPSARVFDGYRDNVTENAIPCVVVEPNKNIEKPAALQDRPWEVISIMAHCWVKSYLHTSGVQGSFIVVTTGTNDKINFTEDGGGARTATLAAGSYEMGSTQADAGTFCAAIATALNAASGIGATYTVSYSVTNQKLTITKNSGVFVILWASGTNTATAANAVMGFSKTDTGSAISQSSDGSAERLKGLLDLEADVKNALKAFPDLNYDSTVGRCNYFKFPTTSYSYKHYPYREAAIQIDAYILLTGATAR